MFVMASMCSGFAQDKFQVQQIQDYKTAKLAKDTKLLVVLDESDTTACRLLKESVKKYWTFNNYDFIKPTDYEKYLKQDGYTLLALSGVGAFDMHSYQIIISNSKISVHKNFVLTACADFQLMLSMPVSKKPLVTKPLSYTYLIPYMVHLFNEQLNDLYNDTKKKSHYSVDNTLYREDADRKIPKMNLLICNEYVKDEKEAKATISKKLKIDESKIKFVSAAEIAKAIADKTPNTAIFTEHYMTVEVFSTSDLEQLVAAITKCHLYY
jgi:hypothetical protein